MSATEPATPKPAVPRDDEVAATNARLDLERAVLPTVVSRRLAWTTVAAFCTLLAVVPIVQIYLEATGRHRSQLADLFYHKANRENLHRYEEEAARNSVFKEAVQPYVQLALTGVTGSGNGQVYVGTGGVLFYRPGMDFVTGKGICDPARLRAREKHFVDTGKAAAEPDPRPAILAFAAACREAGVHLVVVPVPDKVMVEPEAAGLGGGRAVANCDYPRFLAELREAGVDLFDPTPAEPSPGNRPRFLRQDTHWTPGWLEEVARDLAGHVRAKVTLPAGKARYRTEEVVVKHTGDLVDMLGLPPDQTLFPPEEVTARRTVDAATGRPFEALASADVLLLGDSFTNIYSAPQMHWGDSAGLGPTLARHLGRGVDVIAANGKGASGTRAELARRPEGLAGKRVVIWEFAARELTAASWDVIPLPAGPATRPATPHAAPLVVEATIEAASKVPEPFTVPYPDCLTYILLRVDRVVEGEYADKQLLAVMWAMKKNVSLPPAKYQPGRRLRAKLIPLKDADQSVRTGQRADDIADYTHRPYFVTEEHGL